MSQNAMALGPGGGGRRSRLRGAPILMALLATIALAVVIGTGVTLPGLPSSFAKVSLSTSMMALTCAALLEWRPLRRLEFAVPYLCMYAGIGMSVAFLRGWIKSVAGFAADIAPIVGPHLLKMVALAVVFAVVYDIWPGHPTNSLTAIAAMLLPSVSPEIGGKGGELIEKAVGFVARIGFQVITTLFGG